MTRGPMVLEERFRIVISMRDQDARHHRVDLPRGIGSDACGKYLTDPVVIHLHAISRAAVPYQVSRPKARDQRALVAAVAARLEDTRRQHRAPADRQRLEK